MHLKNELPTRKSIFCIICFSILLFLLTIVSQSLQRWCHRSLLRFIFFFSVPLEKKEDMQHTNCCHCNSNLVYAHSFTYYLILGNHGWLQVQRGVLCFHFLTTTIFVVFFLLLRHFQSKLSSFAWIRLFRCYCFLWATQLYTQFSFTMTN